MAEKSILGIHHVTAICGDPQRNVDFYTDTMGLRLVKLTVNFDDPTAYHFYYGDRVGSPGTILTFFNYGEHAPSGAQGAGSFCTHSFAIPVGSSGFWFDRLEKFGVEKYTNSFGEHLLIFEDPDGLRTSLVERERVNPQSWTDGGINGDHAIIDIDSVTLGSRTPSSQKFVDEVLEFPVARVIQMQSGEELKQYQIGDSLMSLLPTKHPNSGGRGTIHHVAWRLADDSAQSFWGGRLQDRHAPVSPVRDRTYFHSIYFREPGGALLELATDPPGFTLDETVSELGSNLKLPPQYESKRKEIEAALPPLKLPVLR